MAYREAPNISEEVPMRWVVRVEAIRDDGTAETVEIGSFERACPTAARDVGLTLSETKPLLRDYSSSSSANNSGGMMNRRGSVARVGPVGR